MESSVENRSPNTSCDSPPKKSTKTVRRKQKFRSEWLSESDFSTWLIPDKSDIYKATCILCKTSMKAEICVIRTHAKGQTHMRNISGTKKQTPITTFTESNINNNSNNSVHRAEIKLCGFLSKHNLSFKIMDHLGPLLKSCFPDSQIAQKIQMKSTKSSAIVKNVIAVSEKEYLASKLKNTTFSILVDESTDISAIKTLCIVIRFYDCEASEIVSRFWDLCQVFSDTNPVDAATAEHLFNIVKLSFDEYQIPYSNIIGFASDGCNTMMGCNNSVATRFQDLCPNICIFKCICHSLHLCASTACKQLPRQCEDLARDVFNFFSASAKRQFQLKEFQEFLDVEVHKILHPSQTRWLSLSSVILRLLEQWTALQTYFTDQVYEAKLHAAGTILNYLNNPIVKLYYLFLKWVLPKFTTLNEIFQSEKPMITSMYDAVKITYLELLQSYMQSDYISQTSLADINPTDKTRFLSSTQIYAGVDVINFFSSPEYRHNERMKEDFFNGCIMFLSTGCNEIKSRFDFGNALLQKLNVLQPSKAMNRRTRNNTPSLMPLMQLLPRIVTPNEYQDVDNEWRRLPNFELPGYMSIKDDPDIFWNKLFKNDSGDDRGNPFKNLSKFVLNVLSLPHSNADCERIFSKVNLIKTKTRNKLITSTVNGLLLSNQRIYDCIDYEPSKTEFSRMTAAILYPPTLGGKKTNSKRNCDRNLRENRNESDEDDFDNVIMPNESYRFYSRKK